MDVRQGTGAGGAINREVKRQSAYILLGLVALAFPFVPKEVIVLGVLLGTIALIYMPKGSPMFRVMASEKDREAGVLLGPLKFCIALLVLAVLVIALDFPVYILAAVIGAVAFGEGSAALVNLLTKGERDVLWSVTLLVVGTAFAFIFGYWALDYGLRLGIYALPLNAEPAYFMFFLAVIGTVTGALLYTIVDEDDVAVPLGAGMAMWLFSSFNYKSVPDPAVLAIAVAVPFAIGIMSYKLNAVDLSGALSGVLLGLFMIIFGGAELEGLKWFALILVFLFLGAMFTKYKYTYKKRLDAAEANAGTRGYKNVFGNCFVPLIFVVLYGVVGSATVPYFGFVDRSIYLIGFLCSMATATADTLASEIGSTYRGRPVMITTLQPVKPGTDGGVSPLGEAASVFGALAIAVAALMLGLTGESTGAMVILTVLIGFLGTNIDSLLGATLQRRRILSNAGVNFVATLIAGLLAMLLYYLFFL